MKTREKLLSVLLAAIMMFPLLPVLTLPALATSDTTTFTFDVTEGSITVSSGSDSGTLKVAYGSGLMLDNIANAQELTIIGNSTSTSNTITVSGSISNTVNITLDSVNINSTGTAFSIGSGTTVNLTLTGTNTLTSGDDCAGLLVPSGATLVITSASTGSLTSTGGQNSAGIGGGGNNGDAGTITICGGMVTANGGSYIGGVATVNSIGGGYGAGIGGGYYGSGGTVTISGGSVTANGGSVTYLDMFSFSTITYVGNGIGRGWSGGTDSHLYISGGSVNADIAVTVYQSSVQTTAVYKTTVSGLPTRTNVTCSSNVGDEFSCATDSSGKLYLWLPVSNKATLYITAGDDDYKALGAITASNGNTLTAAVFLNVTNSVNLKALSVTNGKFSQTFDREIVTYAVTASSGSFGDSIEVTAKLADTYSTLTIGGAAATSGVATTVSLNNGANLIPVTVTSSDGYSQKSYILSVNGTVSKAELKSLSIGGDAQTVGSSSYSYSVGSEVTSVAITAASSDSKAIMLLDGAILKSGEAQSIDLSVGENTITLMVVAQDASTKTYTITVNRGTSDATLKTLTLSAGTLLETFDSSTYSYTASVSNSVSSLTVTPAANDSGATVTVNGASAPTAVALNVGSNTITVKVTGSDGVTTKTYSITVTRETAITITTASLPIGIVGASYSKALSASGGCGTYTWTWAAASGSSLPSSISLSTGGTLASSSVLTNSDIGEYTVEITATDSSDTAVTQTETFTLAIRKGCGGGTYLIVSDGDAAYTGSYTDDGTPTLTVNYGVTGFTYIGVNISDVKTHSGTEICVFVQIRNGQQIAICAVKGDFDTLDSAYAAFNVKSGDVIEVYIVDFLSNSGTSPTIL